MRSGNSFLYNLKEKVKLVSFLIQEALSMLVNKIAKKLQTTGGKLN